MGLKGMKQGTLLAEPFLTLWFYCSDGGLTLETLAFRISVRWSIYIFNSVDKTKCLYTTSPPTLQHSFFRTTPFIPFLTRRERKDSAEIMLSLYRVCASRCLETVSNPGQVSIARQDATGHFGKYHNTLCLCPQRFAQALFSISLGTSSCPRRNCKQ